MKTHIYNIYTHVAAVFSHVSMIHTASFRIASCPLFIVLVGAVKSTCMYYAPLWCMVLIDTTLKVQLYRAEPAVRLTGGALAQE